MIMRHDESKSCIHLKIVTKWGYFYGPTKARVLHRTHETNRSIRWLLGSSCRGLVTNISILLYSSNHHQLVARRWNVATISETNPRISGAWLYVADPWSRRIASLDPTWIAPTHEIRANFLRVCMNSDDCEYCSLSCYIEDKMLVFYYKMELVYLFIFSWRRLPQREDRVPSHRNSLVPFRRDIVCLL